MSVRTFIPVTVAQPRGQWSSLTNRRRGTPARASFMQNMRVQYGTVRCRDGTTVVYPTTDKVTGLFNWIEPNGTNAVLYQDGNLIRAYNQDLATATTLLSGVTSRAPSFAPLDVWTYFAGFDTASAGSFQAQVYDGANVDAAFRPPVVITDWTAVDGGAGQCTSGQHFLGVVYQNRTGYSGVPTTSIDFDITVATNASPCVLTAPGNNLQDDQVVTISGALGNTAINGRRIITNVSGATFHLTDMAGNVINGNGAYTGSGVVANPIQVTLSVGLRQINFSVTLPALSDGGTDANGGVQATLFLIATRADNPNIWYFMPTDDQTGQIGKIPVPFEVGQSYDFVMSLSDEDIATSLSGDTAQDNFLFLAQNQDGTGPFFVNPDAVPLVEVHPSFVVAYGQRMCYGVGTTLYASDLQAPQQISADRNAVRMQNQKTIGMAFQLSGNTNLYLTGDRWTGYVTDNSDVPSTWAQPIGVSNTLGAPYPNCVCADTGGNYAWIVTEGGPYLFDGAYQGMALTYLVQGYDEQGAAVGWTRVNWDAAYAIQIVDDSDNFRLYVAVPMDGATECTHLFVIDYRLGRSFDSCDISLDVFAQSTFSAIAVVKEFSTGLSNLWIGPSAAGYITHYAKTHNDAAWS